jgi:uncharacterized linocin/CFP29 family protein
LKTKETGKESTLNFHRKEISNVLGPLASDSRLRRWGLDLSRRGGKNSKKRAVIAVARKLAVLLHKLWVSGRSL